MSCFVSGRRPQKNRALVTGVHTCALPIWVVPGNIYDERSSGGRDDRPGLAACLKSLRDGDVLIVWKLDRLGRTLTHLVSTVQNLSDRGIGLRVLTGKGAQIDTTTPSGRMVFGIFATLAEFERDMIRERTMAG